MIVGKTYGLATRHPQDMVDDLYNEVYSNHPDESEIDIAVVVKHDSDAKTTQILDLRIFRVSDGNDGTRYKGFDGNSPIDMLREMIEWTRDHGTDSIMMWLHKHPEGSSRPSAKDEDWNDALTAIDFGTSNGSKNRTYTGGAIINRNDSTAIKPSPMALPIGLPSVDGAVVMESYSRLARKHGVPDTDPGWDMIRNLRAAIEADDDERTLEIIPELVAKVQQIAHEGGVGESADKLRRSLLPDEVNAAADRILGGMPTPPPPFLMDLPKELRDLLNLPPTAQFPAMDNIVKPDDKTRLN